jgi:hypothetical protein
MSRGFAVPGAAAGLLLAVVVAIVMLTACGGSGDFGPHELRIATPATTAGPADPAVPALPAALASIVAGAERVVARADARTPGPKSTQP